MISKKLTAAILTAAICTCISVPVFAVRNTVGHTATVNKAEEAIKEAENASKEAATETTTYAYSKSVDKQLEEISSQLNDKTPILEGEGIIGTEYINSIFSDISADMSKYTFSFNQDKEKPDTKSVGGLQAKWLAAATNTNEQLYAKAAAKAYAAAISDVIVIDKHFFKYMAVDSKSYTNAKNDYKELKQYVEELKNTKTPSDVDAVTAKLTAISNKYMNKATATAAAAPAAK